MRTRIGVLLATGLASWVVATSTACASRGSNDDVAACSAQGGVWVDGSGCTSSHCEKSGGAPPANGVLPEDLPPDPASGDRAAEEREENDDADAGIEETSDPDTDADAGEP